MGVREGLGFVGFEGDVCVCVSVGCYSLCLLVLTTVVVLLVLNRMICLIACLLRRRMVIRTITVIVGSPSLFF